MSSIVWAAIGCGDVMERKSGPPLYQLENCELYGVTRRDASAGEDFAKRHSTRFVADMTELVNAPVVTAVYVATPPIAHEEGVLAAARAGKHVLVEKEMAPNAAACQRMVDACDEAGVLLGVAFYRRCYPSINRAKVLIDEGVIGTLRHMSIGDGFPDSHRLDLGHYFLGDFTHISVREAPMPPGSTTDTGDLLSAINAAGTTFQTRASWDGGDRTEVLRFCGDMGTIDILDLKEGHLRIATGNGVRDEDVGPLPFCHWGLIANFAAAIQGTEPLACTGEEGRKSTVIMDTIKAIPANGNPVAITY